MPDDEIPLAEIVRRQLALLESLHAMQTQQGETLARLTDTLGSMATDVAAIAASSAETHALLAHIFRASDNGGT